MIIVLYNIIMKYFDGIEWVGFNHAPECRAEIGKYFHDYYVLDYNHEGNLILQLDDGPPIKLKSPVAWFTFPGPFFSFRPEGKTSWDHRHISFRGSRVGKWIESGLVDFRTHCPVIPVTDPERFVRLMDEILEYLGSPSYGSNRAVQMFEGLLLQLHEQRPVRPAISPVVTKVSELIMQIDRRPEMIWNFKSKAKQFGVSYSHFRLIFHRLVGMPPHQYMNRKRMEKAARLLRENRLEIKEIATQVGYESIFHFAKLFKHHFRTPPGSYRARSILR